jgi:hypothetical protein
MNLNHIKKNLLNIPGWRTKRKIIVIESDDWGSIRMPSKKVFDELLNYGLRVDLCPYNKFDTIASRDDFEILFNTLNSFKDFKGNHPVITANSNVANPDFRKIQNNNFEHYFFELFTNTLKNYYPNENVFEIWNEGITAKLFLPQLHGREHVNPIIWMNLLRENHIELKKAFEKEVFGLSRITSPNIVKMHLASLIFTNKKEKDIIENSLIEGANIFESIFNFRSKSFIAPVYTWDSQLEPTLNSIGIKYIQGGNSHKNYSNSLDTTYKVKRHFTGNRNVNNQIYINRNCFFEPSLTNNYKIENTLKEIEIAFNWNKPAIISSHRVNFIGALDFSNRERNIKSLNLLLHRIILKWPNVEFMSTVQLGELIENRN